MKRGELYRVQKPSSSDPKKFRVFIVVSRQILIDSRFSTFRRALRGVGYEPEAGAGVNPKPGTDQFVL